MTVFVTQQPAPNKRGWTPDLTPAAQYGQIEYVFEGGEAVYANPQRSMQQAKARLKDFNPALDFVLYPGTGDPAAAYATIMAINSMGITDITYLYWDRIRDENGQRSNKGVYVPVKFSLDD